MDISTDDYKLMNMTAINVVLGKNGCGKSTLLRKLSQSLDQDGTFGAVKYITPERGGALVYEPNVDNNVMIRGRGFEVGFNRDFMEHLRAHCSRVEPLDPLVDRRLR